eukprot:TRINITY_DN2624_c0_g1_i4.p2 TRINITY_DN2624_c0_g1~~TRINITY_DN2624_c0_g1_i4.p2  ORF type:complete len:172 (-),score=11.90 TRINITY_DN2624_c0_g1_i4:741-1256(-)
MQELQAIEHLSFFEFPGHVQDLQRRQSELAILAGRRPEMAGMLRPEFRPQADNRSDVEFPADFDHQIELFFLLENNHSIQVELPRNQSERDVFDVFVAIADQETFRIAFAQTAHSEEELRFRSGFEAEPERFTELDDVFNDEPVLVAFHRINSLVMRIVTLRSGRGIERKL